MHRIEPVAAIGNAPLIPRLAALSGFDLLHLHYPFIFGAELVLAGRLRRGMRDAALLVHYKNRLVADGPRGALFGAYEHSVAPALIRAADRVCVLSRDHAASVPYLGRALRDTPERVVEMPNGVDVERSLPAPMRPGARRAGDTRGRGRGRLRRHPGPRPPLQAPRRGDRRAGPAAASATCT